MTLCCNYKYGDLSCDAKRYKNRAQCKHHFTKANEKLKVKAFKTLLEADDSGKLSKRHKEKMNAQSCERMRKSRARRLEVIEHIVVRKVLMPFAFLISIDFFLSLFLRTADLLQASKK
jgi:hypothetical protein